MATDPLEEILSRWGPSALKRLGEAGPVLGSGAIPSGYPALDRALGVGGIPRGKIVEIFGPPSSGALTLALKILAHAQENGAPVALIDPLQTLDASYASQAGVNLEQLAVIVPKSGREAFDIAYTLLSSNALALLALDLTLPQASRNWSSLLISQGIRRLAGILSRSNAAFLVVNRMREDKESPAGRALRHFASIRMKVARTDWLYQGEDIIGCRSEIHVVKNKLAPPYRKAEIEILYQPDRENHGDST